MRALELISDNAGRAEIRTEIAVIYQKDSNLKKAERELALAVRLDDTSSTSWNQLGVCRAGMGRIEEGCRAYRKAISLDPRNYEAWLNLASAHKEVGNCFYQVSLGKDSCLLHGLDISMPSSHQEYAGL